MPNKNKLIFFCGKMGAGKSTRAKVLAKQHNALLLSEDDWLAAHYPDIETFEDYLRYAQRIKPFVRDLVMNMLKNGVSVVMDFPANTQRQRRWFLDLAQDANCDHELHYLNRSDQHCLKQLAQRNKEQPERAAFDTPAVFEAVTRYFEAPTESEGLHMIESRSLKDR